MKKKTKNYPELLYFMIIEAEVKEHPDFMNWLKRWEESQGNHPDRPSQEELYNEINEAMEGE